jgi:plasmid stability protein
MVQILVRRLPEHVKSALKLRASKRGVSMEAEARDILIREIAGRSLRDAVPEKGLGTLARELFADIGFAEDEFVRPQVDVRAVDFDEYPAG